MGGGGGGGGVGPNGDGVGAAAFFSVGRGKKDPSGTHHQKVLTVVSWKGKRGCESRVLCCT